MWLDPLQCLRRSDILKTYVVEFSFVRFLISAKLGDKNEGHLEALRQQIEHALNSSDTSSENIEEVVAEDCSVNNISAASEDIISSKNESAKNLQVR